MERLTFRCKYDGSVMLKSGATNVLDRLAAYEDAEERGELVRLPCHVGAVVFRVWITDGREPEITAHKMNRLIDIVQWLDKFGKTVFLSCEEAEAAIKGWKLGGGLCPP